tara:strand:+ start:535 stop:795 length:261 start_codon:yes stop_codon:yes gene_type:complete
MITQEILNWVMFAFGAVMSGLVKAIWDSVKDLQSEDKNISNKLSEMQVLVAGDYVKKEDFNALADKIFIKLDIITEKVVNKADRTS